MATRRVAYLLLGSGGSLLIAVAVAAYLLLLPSSFRVDVTAPILVTTERGAASIIEAHNSPALVVDPADDRHLVLAARLDRPRFGCRVFSSTDGGGSWTPSAIPLPAGQDTCYAADVAFLNGQVFLTYLTLNTRPRDPLSGGNDPNGMYLLRSDDGGKTFGSSVTLPGKDDLQPRIAVDPGRGVLYVVYVKGGPLQNDTPLGLGPPPNPIMVISSPDGGRTFSDPRQVNDLRRIRVGAATPLVTSAGELLVLYQDYKNDLEDYQNKSLLYEGTFALVLARSSDSGLSFSESVVDDAQVRPHRFLIYTPPFPALAISPDGTSMYAAWSDGRDGAPDVLLRGSHDGGRTWSAPTKLNDRRPDSPANYELPALVAPDRDRVEAVFYAFSGTPPRGRVQYTYSTDGGRRFQAPIAVGPDFDATIGVPSARDLGGVEYGSRLSLATTQVGLTLMAWSDPGRGSADTGRTDINFARVALR
ncbi:MAG: hypothetical protein NVS9B6_17470 [Candidatus Limnocylindrales bacterium]